MSKSFASTLLSLFASIFVGSIAHAGFLLAPEVGYSTGTNLNYTYSNTQYEFTQSAVPVGLRLGFVSANGFWLAAHGDYAFSGTLNSANSSVASGTDSFTRTTAGVEVGVEHSRFRIFAGYNLLNNISITPASANTHSPAGFQGTGFFGGIGVHASHHLTIDILYSTSSFSTYSQTSANGGQSNQGLGNGNYSAISDSTVALMFGFPLGGAVTSH